MAFDYKTLKQIKNDAFVDGTLSASDIVDNSITSIKIQDGAVSTNKVADSAVDLTGSKVTGTLPINQGGTNRTSLGSAYQVLRVNSSNNALEFGNTGLQGMNVYTGNGTWNRPNGVRYIKVCVVGGGGGGSGHGEAGGAGGYAEEIINVTGISSVSITIGGGGGNTYYANRGGNGGTTSFGPYLSAGGGSGANRNNQHSGGVGAIGSGGNLNIYGGGGQSHEARSSVGGVSFWGGNTAAGHPQGGQFTYNHRNHSAPGSGGSGGYFHGNRGAPGRGGMVVVYNYY